MGWGAPTTVTCIKFWQKWHCHATVLRGQCEMVARDGAVRPARGGATRSVRAARSARDDTTRPVRDAARSVQDSATRSARDGAARSMQDGYTRSVRDGAARSVQMVEGLYVRSIVGSSRLAPMAQPTTAAAAATVRSDGSDGVIAAMAATAATVATVAVRRGGERRHEGNLADARTQPNNVRTPQKIVEGSARGQCPVVL